MNPLSHLRLLRPARLSCLAALPLLLTLAPTGLFAQQQWPQTPQYSNGQVPQYDPNAGQYPPSQQPPDAQQPYPYPAIDQDSGQGYPQPGYAQSQPPAQPLAADQLEQLVAPIALYPDTLVAQVLTAATYPAQVAAADQWLQAQGYASPDQIAYAANAQSWDPSVKALTAFPQVLALIDRDLQWTTNLGNAYYNQPQDVLQTVQVLRQRAQAAGTLQNTPQEEVSYNQGYIQLAPADPQLVYVPAYNPWYVYGQPIQPYPGFSLLGALESFAGSAPVRYGLGVAISAFSHTPFGWAGWALNWLTQSVLFHQSNYYSHSTSVAHWASPRGSPAFASQSGGVYRSQQAFARPSPRYSENYPQNRPYAASRFDQAPSRGYSSPGNFVRPALPVYAYAHPQAPVRPQPYARPGGYGSSFYSNRAQAYAPRSGGPYSTPRQSWRAPASTYYQRNELAKRSYSERSYPSEGFYQPQRSYSPAMGRGYAESNARPEKSGGFHLFGNHNAEKSYGGGRGFESPHASYRAPKAPKPPKAPKAYGGSHHSGGGHHFGGGFGGHRR